MPLNDYAFSMQMRDTIRKMVAEEIDRSRPRYRYGQVTAIDPVARKVDVQLNGETGSVRVNMGGIQPGAIGQIVRVEGIGTDKFITDVIGGMWRSSTFESQIGTVAPYHSQGPVYVTWEGDSAQSGPYSLIARGYRPRGGDKVGMVSTSDGIMLIPAYDNAAILDWQPPPQWYYVADTVGLQNGWVEFNNMTTPLVGGLGNQFYSDHLTGFDPLAWLPEHSRPGFAKSASGIVKLRGLVKNGTTTSPTLLFTLPAGYRPAARTVFAAESAAGSGTGRVDVYPDGGVYYVAGSASWTSLANITFPNADVAPDAAWTHVPAYVNSYADYGSPYSLPSYWTDRNNWIHYRGLVKKTTTYVHNTIMWTMPTGNYGSTRSLNVRGSSNNAGGNTSFMGSGGREVRSKNPSVAAWQSLDGICYPRGISYNDDEWKIMPGLNGWVGWDPTDVADGYAHAQVTKTRDGLVCLRGTVKNAATMSSSVICNIPIGYRPKAIYLFGTIANDLAVRTDVRPTGDILQSGSITAGLYWAFDSMTWFAEW